MHNLTIPFRLNIYNYCVKLGKYCVKLGKYCFNWFYGVFLEPFMSFWIGLRSYPVNNIKDRNTKMISNNFVQKFQLFKYLNRAIILCILLCFYLYPEYLNTIIWFKLTPLAILLILLFILSLINFTIIGFDFCILIHLVIGNQVYASFAVEKRSKGLMESALFEPKLRHSKFEKSLLHYKYPFICKITYGIGILAHTIHRLVIFLLIMIKNFILIMCIGYFLWNYLNHADYGNAVNIINFTDVIEARRAVSSFYLSTIKFIFDIEASNVSVIEPSNCSDIEPSNGSMIDYLEKIYIGCSKIISNKPVLDFLDWCFPKNKGVILFLKTIFQENGFTFLKNNYNSFIHWFRK